MESHWLTTIASEQRFLSYPCYLIDAVVRGFRFGVVGPGVVFGWDGAGLGDNL